MTRDDIIRMAWGATDHLSDADSIRLQGIVLLALDAGAAAEREACAKVCEDKNTLLRWPTYAAAIRARGEKK